MTTFIYQAQNSMRYGNTVTPVSLQVINVV
jgi:hypothetical protein